MDAKQLAEMDAIVNGGDFDAMDAVLAEEPSAVAEVGGQLATGIVKGIPNLLDAGGAVVATAADKAMGGDMPLGETFKQYADQAPVSRGVDQALSNLSRMLGGGDVEETAPETTAGRYANMAGQGLSTAPLVGLSGLRGMVGGLGSEVGGDAGEMVAGTPGRIAGTIIGGGGAASAPDVIGPLTSRAKAAFQKAIVPTLEPDTAALAKRAGEMGVPLSLTQAAPSRARDTVQKISQAVPASGVKGFEQTQVAGWNKALAKTIGLESDKLTPEMVNEFLGRTSKGYDEALAGTTVRFSKDAVNQLRSVSDEAYKAMDSSLADVVAKNAGELIDQVKGGFVKGEKVASIRRNLMNRASKATGEVKDAISDMVSVMDDIARQSMPAEKVEALNVLNRQYRNYKTLEPLLEKSVDGTINPTQLLQRVASSKFIKGSRIETGTDDLVDLARIGKLMPKLGGSDTFDKGMLAAGGAAAVAEPVTTAAIVGGNRAYQKLYNQSQTLLGKSIEKSLPKGVSGASVKAASSALQGGTVDDFVKAAGGAAPALSILEMFKRNGSRDVQKEAFDLRKKINGSSR